MARVIGNDIVDLKKATADSDWSRKGYLDKIFTIEEQSMIRAAPYPGLMIWVFWSMKEAAYKIVNRSDRIRQYNPLAFECAAPDVGGKHPRSTVTHEGYAFHTETYINHHRVHSVAAMEGIMLETVCVHYMDNLTNYADEFNQKHNHIRLSRDTDGLPQIVSLSDNQITPASVSHHGRFLAVIYSDFLRSED